MDILLRPDTLSLVGSMNHFIISSAAEISFILKSGDDVIIRHSYTPGPTGRIEISLEGIVMPLLSFKLSDVSEPYRQPTVVRTFTAVITPVTQNPTPVTYTFSVIRAGIDHFADSAENFLKSNFLTWQPTVKPVTYYTPEFLTYYAVVNAVVRCKAYVDEEGSNTTHDLTLATLGAGEAWTIPVGYAVIAGKLGKLPSYYDLWVEDNSGTRLTYIQRYYASDLRSEQEQWILFENSLGGIDTFRAYGDSEHTAKHTHNVVEIENDSEEYRVDTERLFKKNTGFLNKNERRWLLDFFPSLGKFLYIDSYIRRIVVTDSDAVYQVRELPSSFSFTYKYADARPYLNLPRAEMPPEMLDIKVPDVGSFTIAPRLVEFPRQTLSEGALFPVQSPYSETWGTTTVAALYSYITRAIVQAYKGDGSFGHTHDNMSVLAALNRAELYLTLNAQKISAGYADEAGVARELAKNSPDWDKILRTDMPGTARELITFLKGIAFAGGKGIDGNGNAILGKIQSERIENSGEILTKDLTVTGSAHFFQLVIDNIKSIGGAYISSPADGFEIAKVEPVEGSDPNAAPARYRLYWRATDGKRARANMWEVGDQALSMDFNDAQKGVVMQNVSNSYWWSCVLAVSDAPVTTTIDGVEHSCHYIEVSNEGSVQNDVYTPAVNTQGWDMFNKTKSAPMWTGALKPVVGDSVAMLGHRFTSAADQDRRRQSAVYESSYVSLDVGLTAPLKAYYIGIDDFNLSNHRRSYSDAYGSKTVGTFEVVSEGEIKPLDTYISEKAGVGSVLYQLQLTPDMVKIDKDGNMNTTRITPKVVKVSGGRVVAEWRVSVVPATEARVWFKTSRMSSFGWMTGMDFIDITSDMAYVEFGIADSEDQTKLFDKKTVFFVKDGSDGGSGYTITCMPNALIFDTNNAGKLPHGLSKTVVVSVRRGNEIIDVTGKVAVVQTGFVNISSAGVNVISGTAGVSVRPSYISTDENGIPCTSASFMIEVTLPDTILYYTVPISVNVNRYLSTIESNSKEYKRRLDEFTGGETSMRAFKTEVLQTAREISQEVSEKAAGAANLLKDSELKRLDSVSVRWPHLNVCVVKNRGYNGTNAMRVNLLGITGDDTNYNGLFWSGEHIVKIEKGATYTFSFLAMSPDPAKVEGVWSEIIFWDSPTGGRKSQLASMNLQGQLTTAYRLFTHTFTIPEDAQYEYIEITLFSLRNGEVYFSRPCLTKTSKYTGWSKSKDDKEYIGGNLIRGSQKFDASEFQAAGTLTPNGYEEFTTLQLNSSCQYTFAPGEIKPDTDYMLSMWVKISGSTSIRFKSAHEALDTCRLVENSDGQFTTDPYDARDGHSQLSAQAEFTRVWVHFRTRSTVPAQVRLYITGSGELCGMKLEQGADMTAWTDSRETLNFSLKDFTSYIRQSSRKIELGVTDGLHKTGIDVKNREIVLSSENVYVQDKEGRKKIALNDKGQFKADMVEAREITADIIAQPFEEYDTTEAFLQGKQYAWVITSAAIFNNNISLKTHKLNGAIINVHNYTNQSIRFLTRCAYRLSSESETMVYGDGVVEIPPGLLFRAIGIRHVNGPPLYEDGKEWPFVALYPLGRVRKESGTFAGQNRVFLKVISPFE